MKKLLVPVSALSLALTLGVANAAQVKGKIEAVSSDHTWFTLTNGMEFSLGEGASASALRPGARVIVTYASQSGNNVASEVAKTHNRAHIRVSTPSPMEEVQERN